MASLTSENSPKKPSLVRDLRSLVRPKWLVTTLRLERTFALDDPALQHVVQEPVYGPVPGQQREALARWAEYGDAGVPFRGRGHVLLVALMQDFKVIRREPGLQFPCDRLQSGRDSACVGKKGHPCGAPGPAYRPIGGRHTVVATRTRAQEPHPRRLQAGQPRCECRWSRVVS